MTNNLDTRTTKVCNLAGAALAALVTLMTLTLVAPAAAHAAGETASVNPSTAVAGEPVTISGSGFLPGEGVEVWYGGLTIASGVADGSGDFSVSGAIPAGMPEGGHPMDVVGSMGSMVSFSYTVTAPPVPPAAPASPAAPPGSPATPPAATKTPAALGLDGSVDGAGSPSVGSGDRDGETELALADTVDSADGVGSTVKVWGLVLLVLAASGLAVCVVAVRRSERERA